MTQPDERISQGTLRTSTGRPLPLERTDVKATLSGPVAGVEVRQVFRNDTGGPIEAVYLFPLPHEASVHTMRFRIGERVVEGTVKEKEEARRIYAAARAEGRSATLLEQDRPNLFTLSVANIPPGERVEVTLGYQERLAYDDGEWRFVFPMVAAERFHAAPAAGAGELRDAPGIRPPRAASNDRAPDVGVEVEILAGQAIQAPRSPSHRVIVEPIPGVTGGYRARLAEEGAVPNRDFVLAYRTGLEGVRARAHFQRKADAIGTFLLAITPPVAPPPDLVAAASHGGSAGEAAPLVCGNCGGALGDPGAVRDVPGIGKAFRCAWCGTVLAASPDRKGAKVGLPRDVVFLVDRSCSMRGPSLPQARRAVRLVLDALVRRRRVPALRLRPRADRVRRARRRVGAEVEGRREAGRRLPRRDRGARRDGAGGGARAGREAAAARGAGAARRADHRRGARQRGAAPAPRARDPRQGDAALRARAGPGGEPLPRRATGAGGRGRERRALAGGGRGDGRPALRAAGAAGGPGAHEA